MNLDCQKGSTLGLKSMRFFASLKWRKRHKRGEERQKGVKTLFIHQNGLFDKCKIVEIEFWTQFIMTELISSRQSHVCLQ